MSTATTLADEFAQILCDRSENLENRYTAVVEAVSNALEDDWEAVFGPWLDSIQERVEEQLGKESQ